MKKFQQDISLLDFSRVAIIGCPGSGKTTFSKSLAKVLQREVVHLDKILWNPNWQMMDYESRVVIHNALVAQENWIIDGMWRSHLPRRFQRATLVVFLDYSRSLCLRRAIWRRIKFRGKQREDIADGCLEKLDGYFLNYIWKFRKDVRPLILQLQAENPQICTVTLKNPKQAKIFLQQMENYFENA